MLLVHSMVALVLFLEDSEAFEVAFFWMVVMKSQDFKFPEPCGIVTVKES